PSAPPRSESPWRPPRCEHTNSQPAKQEEAPAQATPKSALVSCPDVCGEEKTAHDDLFHLFDEPLHRLRPLGRAHCPAVGRRQARHRRELIAEHRVDVRRADYGPRFKPLPTSRSTTRPC